MKKAIKKSKSKIKKIAKSNVISDVIYVIEIIFLSLFILASVAFITKMLLG